MKERGVVSARRSGRIKECGGTKEGRLHDERSNRDDQIEE